MKFENPSDTLLLRIVKMTVVFLSNLKLCILINTESRPILCHAFGVRSDVKFN